MAACWPLVLLAVVLLCSFPLSFPPLPLFPSPLLLTYVLVYCAAACVSYCVCSPKLKQRWRKTDPDCRGSLCVWKPLLEAADKECKKEDCSDACKGDECGETKDPVEVCTGLGCQETTPSSEAADPLAKQLSEGALDGHADPFGLADALDDKQEPAEGVYLDLGLRSHFRTHGGEPVGDAVVRGWDMHNGGTSCLFLACGPSVPAEVLMQVCSRVSMWCLEVVRVVVGWPARPGARGWLHQACEAGEALSRDDVHALD